MANIEARILQTLNEDETIADSWDFAQSNQFDYVELVGVQKSLQADFMITAEPLSKSFWVLTEEGKNVLETGSPEVRVFNGIPAEGIAMADYQANVVGAIGAAVEKVGRGQCMKNKWIRMDKAENKLYRVVESVEDTTVAQLRSQDSTPEGEDPLDGAIYKALKRRQLVTQITRKSFRLLKGPEFALERKRKAADLTKEMLDSGEWSTTQFKEYNFKSVGRGVGGGNLHPLLKVRAEFRKILMQMGFNEMPTNRFVESSFWNFDALFQPQSHPARDMHDTFFVSEPASTLTVPEDYYERVRTMHEKGGFGSIGYRYDFQRGEAMKNLLRTHTTAISAQMLYRLANQPGGFKPTKYFSIDRVFRNESMDATHLCEFHQVEGLVADRNLSLGDLIGVIKTFFEKIGITQLRFKPAYNPYTEPSMEIFGYHPDLKKWTEIGNSGIFRPEMLRPMGLPEDVRVIAWGLSLERPTMIKYRIANIRDLFGHKVDMNQTKTAPISRFF